MAEVMLEVEQDNNRPISQIPQCIRQISHKAPFHMCSHFCYKMVHCGIVAVILQTCIMTDILIISIEIALRWMPQDFTNDKSTLDQVMV